MSFSKALTDSILCCDAYDKDKYYAKTQIYSFTTENISGYINEFELKNKSLLTVGSSGDQVINAILHNCKDVTLYDIVPDSRYYYYLKCAGMISLGRTEFLKFFRYRDYYCCYKENKDVFSHSVYNSKIKDVLRELDYESFLYFDELFNTFTGLTIRKALFVDDEDLLSNIRKSNDYLKSYYLYNETANKLKKVKPKFICGDIKDIDEKTKYDNIWLSNIPTWMGDKEEIFKILIRNYGCLNENGKLLASYLYHPRFIFKTSEISPVYWYKKMLEELKEYNIEFKDIECMSKYYGDDKDGILVLQKHL